MTKFNTEKLLEKYPDAAKELFELQEALSFKTLQRKGQESFITYIKHMWPDFIEGEHHKIFAEKLERVAAVLEGALSGPKPALARAMGSAASDSLMNNIK